MYTEPRPQRGGSSTPLLVIGAAVVAVLFVCCIGGLAIAYMTTNGFQALTGNSGDSMITPTLVANSQSPATDIPPTGSSVTNTVPQKSTTPAPAGTLKKPTPTETPLPTPTTAPLPKAKSVKMNSPEYGVQAFMWWRPETADRDAGLAKEIGMTWLKQQFAWRDIEGAGKGKFDWSHPDLAVNTANAKGLDLLARVDNAPEWAAPGCFNADKKTMGPAKKMQDWVDFLTAFVSRYKGRIRAYEIWNEPNLSREWCGQPPNPAEYVNLLKISYQTIKAIDPNAVIISAGLTPTSQSDARAMPDMQFVERMYAAMNNKSDGYFDLLGVHAAGYKAPPEMSPDDVAKNPAYNNNEGAGGRIYCFRHVEDIRKIMVAHGDSAKQIAILEFGWTMDNIHPAYAWFSVDEQTHGKYIVDAYTYAKKNWAPWIGPMFVIYLANPDWTQDNEEFWWAIDQPDGTPRAAWVRLKALKK
jgi:hypothetical protein